MGTNIDSTTFRCYNDCLMSGCPSHVLRVEYQNTSDHYSVYVDNKLDYGADPSKMGAMIKVINDMRESRVEIDSMLKEAGL